MDQGTTAAAVTSPPDQAAIRQQVLAEERKRVAELSERGKIAGMSAEFISGHISGGTTQAEFADAVFAAMAARGDQDIRPSHAAVTKDSHEHLRIGMADAIMHRINPAHKLDERGRKYANCTLMEMAKATLTASGRNPEGMSVSAISEAVFASPGMHSSGDFPYILANVANQTLLAAYTAAAPTYLLWTKPATAPDFRQLSRIRLGESPMLKSVPEGGTIEHGTLGENREVYALGTYGVQITFTRQMLINDKLDAFSSVIPGFGVQVARMRNKTAYTALTANAAMSDGVALFHSTHANVAGSGGAISIATLDAGRVAMALQTGLDGETPLNMTPRFLLVPVAKQLLAQQFTNATGVVPTSQTSFNPFNGQLQTISDAELDLVSTTAWYLLANAADAGVEFCTLAGEPGPRVETRNEWSPEGYTIKIVDDHAAKATGFRGLYRNAGA